MDNVAAAINKELSTLDPIYLDIVNESHMHSGDSESSHYKVTLVAEIFSGKRPVGRHQLVYGLLNDLLSGPIHALALHTYAPDEWQGQENVPHSPNCRGGSESSPKQ